MFEVPVRLIQTKWPPNDGVRPGNERFDAVLASIKQIGILEPILIDLQWVVIDGHHRLYAARRLGIEYVSVKVWTGIEWVE
jgi:ParB-like chromosome segregation protein Spo0J